MSTSGSARGVSVDGTEFRVNADVDMTAKFSPFETEAMPNTGNTMMKKTIISPNIEGVELSVDADEIETLKSSAEKTESYPLSIALADGVEWKCEGQISMGDYSTADGKVEIIMIPSNALTGWTKF